MGLAHAKSNHTLTSREPNNMSGFLASVNNLQDAIIVSQNGADIIDLKEPSQGALGGLSTHTIQTVVDHLWETSVVSATVGDLEADITLILDRIEAVADTGVDYVKVGMFSQRHIEHCLPSFAYHARRGVKIIAVLFADLEFDMLATIHACKQARLCGVMLDTAGKKSGSLRQHRSLEELIQFVSSAQQLGLLTGLAGSLRAQDIATLMPLEADYLGFRTALCRDQVRTAAISECAVKDIRSRIQRDLSHVQHA